MAKYLDKWKDLFPETVGGTTRPSEAVSDQEEFNTDGFPQFIAQDPVNYALQNAFLKQFLSNDAWLWVKQQQANQALDKHKGDAQAHPNGISGNAASATKLQTARSLNLGGAVTADASTFDGTANATINVKTLDATKLKGTASVSTTGNAATATKVVTTAASGASANIAEATMASNDYARIRVSGVTNAGELALETADDGSEPIVARQYTGAYTNAVRTAKILDESGNTSFPGTVVAPKFTGTLNGNAATATKLQTARKINITGNATGSAAFDGTSDVSINVSVSQAAHADKATNAGSANKLFYSEYGGNGIQKGANDFSPTVGGDSANMNITSWYGVSFTNGCNSGVIPQGKTAVGIDVRNSVVRAKTFEGTLNGNSATATKLATPRTISLTGNASGSATFDGSADANISVTVNESKHAVNADTAANANKLASESGSNYLFINTEEDNWSVIGPNPGNWLKSIRTDVSAPPYSIGNYSTAIAFGGRDTKGIITHAYGSPDVKFAGGAGSTASWKFTIHGGSNNEFYDLNNFPTKTGGGASGTWGINISGNAASASKLSTARKINITGDATGSANFDGSGNVSINTTVNESKHAAAATALDIYAYRPDDANIQKGDGLVRHFLATSGMSKNKPPEGDGHILSFAWDNNGGFDAQLCVNNATGRINMRGQNAGKWSDWLTVLDSANFNSYAPTKTGAGASGTWPISVSGNATTATNADKVDGYHENSFLRYRGDAAATGEDTLWSQIGIKGYEGKLPKGVSGTYNYGAVVSLPGNNTRLDIWYNHQCSTNKDGLWYRSGWGADQKAWARLLDSNNYTNWAPTKTGSGASGTWGINISGNAASATNADKLDGYHASDLLRTLGGNRTPVITDIFDRAGTIDMSTLSAADKATNKANINKASNMTQNIWNNSSGIRAYGGDNDMAGYNLGTLKLTQSYKNFDKILVVNSNDDGDWIAYSMWDVWELAHAFANSYRFNLFGQGNVYWNLYGTAKHGTTTNYAVSTDTVWSCQRENSGIIAIYGIKF